MPLKGKYLKYSPEITLEIFTLVWNKLIENGCKLEYSKEIIFERFKFHERVLRYDSNRNYVYPLIGNNSCKETTVQEILGYDPFIKEEVIPKYVELLEGFDSTCTGKIFDTNQPIPQMSGWSNQWTWESIFKNDIQRPYFKPSTKEAFDAQNKPIEKWSVGSYFVIEKDRLYNISSSTRGDICIIKEDKTFNFINKKDQTDWCFDFREGSRWFATKVEAEEFAKTLVEPVKDTIKCEECNGTGEVMTAKLYPNGHTEVNEKCPICGSEGIIDKPKQPLKQAVHCKSLEEYKFLKEKISTFHENVYSKTNDTVKLDKPNSTWSLGDCKDNNYQILSFQEWCDLNGYKMKKEVKFEVGKWYKAYYAEKIYFLKYKNTIPRNGYNQINCSEFINNGVYKINDSISNTDLENSFKVLDDLEEIHHYLPDGHPDLIKTSQEFKVGEYIFVMKKDRYYGDVLKITSVESDEKNSGVKGTVWIKHENSSFSGGGFRLGSKYRYNEHVRHATPEEINNHLISIGQIPTGEPLNTGIKPNKDGVFKYTTYSGTTYVGKTSTISGPLKMTLSIDDEELPMVNIIKTNSIKQLLSDD